MLTHLCRFLQHNQPQPRFHKTRPNRGQIIVIFAVTLLALLFFSGLAIDSGSLYVTYSQMRRAIDAAAVAAANDYKAEGAGGVVDKDRMAKAALEVMKLHDLNESTMDLKVYLCTDSGIPAEFLSQCPVAPDSPRKLVWIAATQKAPLYFLSLLGFQSVPLQAHAIAEAAPIDLVIVIDTSESMANATPGYAAPFDPSVCNGDATTPSTCAPLSQAMTAAIDLIETLYDGYDHIAVIGYDVTAPELDDIAMRETIDEAIADVNLLKAHDDPPYNLIQSKWFSVHKAGVEMLGFNPVYPEDRDGDGVDADPTIACTLVPPTETAERWDATINPFSLDEGGTPCDDETKFDAYDWDASGSYNEPADNDGATAWLVANGCDGSTTPPTCPDPYWTYFTPNSTCTGCGIRAGAQVLKRDGRSNAVWVMVLLSDGLVNLSDTNATNSNISATNFPLGYCKGGIGSFMWANDCVDINKAMVAGATDFNSDGDTTDPGETYTFFGDTRNCLDSPASACPPSSVSVLDDVGTLEDESAAYTPYDYALDMIDYASLQKSANPQELSGSDTGSDIAIYAVGLGAAGDQTPGASGPLGEYLLRYMAAVGDDGERLPDPCAGVASKTNCGQYYYTATGTGLGAIFNEISTRIYSRLTQ